ncbi:MAG: phosphotransferase, partial [Pseudomonadota bacterium]
AVLHAEPGALVLAHIPGRTLTPADLAAPATLRAVIDLLRRVADSMPSLYVGAARDRRPTSVLAAYQTVIEAQASDPWRRRAARFAPAVEQLAALPEPPPAFVHGDIHAGNILDDGERFWLVDWEYAGLGVVGQDLASLVANGPATEPDRFAEAALVAWLGRPPGVEDRRALWHGLLGATLRDLFWGFAQASIDEELAASDYLSINERRVLTVLDHLDRVRFALELCSCNTFMFPLWLYSSCRRRLRRRSGDDRKAGPREDYEHFFRVLYAFRCMTRQHPDCYGTSVIHSMVVSFE